MIARALTIAGSDPSGGAGVQQDLRTFAALGVWGASAITAITVQDTARVVAYEPVDPSLVLAQIDAVLHDLAPGAVKTGMVPTAAIVETVARAARDNGVERLVVDPVMLATAGAVLQSGDALEAIRAELLPRALIVTPNADEASALTGITVTDRSSMVEAARALRALGARAAYVKGGHLGIADDYLDAGDGGAWLAGGFVEAGPIHGTGCVLSAALTAMLARGASITDAAATAKNVVARAIEERMRIGSGASVLFPRAEVEG